MTAGQVVVGVDGSARDEVLVRWAAGQAAAGDAELVVLTSVSPDGAPLGSLSTAGAAALAEVMRRQDADVDVDALAETARAEHGITVHPVRSTAPAAASMLSYDDASLLVVGTTGKGLGLQLLVGSTSLTVLGSARVPVAAIAAAARTDSVSGRIVVGVDGSADSAAAGAWAIAEAARRGAAVTAVNTWSLEVVDGYVVTEPDSPEWQAIEARQRNVVEQTLAGATAAHPDVPLEIVVERSGPASALLAVAATADLVVMGSRGRGGVKGQLLGSVSQRVLRSAPCPVVVVKA